MQESSSGNNEPTLSPSPAAQEEVADGSQPARKIDEYNAYNFVADKVGFVPNIRKSDNVLQAKIFLMVWAACIVIGAIWAKGDGALIGGLLGIVAALIVSGAVLMVVGLKRNS